GDLAPFFGDAAEDPLDDGEGVGTRGGVVLGEEPVEERVGIDRPRPERATGGQGLRQRGQPHQQEEQERYRGEQRVEGERAREEWNVVFVGGLERPQKEAAGRNVPPPARRAAQASGSSTSASEAAARRRARAAGAGRAPPRPGIGKAALELLTGAGRGATPRRGAGERLVVQLLLVFVGKIGERRLAAAELLAQLVELFLPHWAELPA